MKNKTKAYIKTLRFLVKVDRSLKDIAANISIDNVDEPLLHELLKELGKNELIASIPTIDLKLECHRYTITLKGIEYLQMFENRKRLENLERSNIEVQKVLVLGSLITTIITFINFTNGKNLEELIIKDGLLNFSGIGIIVFLTFIACILIYLTLNLFKDNFASWLKRRLRNKK